MPRILTQSRIRDTLSDSTIVNTKLLLSVRVATTVAGTLATSFEAGDTIDGIVLVTSDRILIKDQVSGIENGVYTVNSSGSPTRVNNMLDNSSASGKIVFVDVGDLNSGTGWIVNNDPASDVVGTNPLVFAKDATTSNEQIIIFDENTTVPVTSTSGTGRIWVRNDTPSVLIFTNDVGTDLVLGSGGGGSSIVVYSLVNIQLSLNSTTFSNASYFPWIQSRYGSYTSGIVIFEAVIVDREASLQLFDTTGASILGTTTTVGSGFYSFTVTNPAANSRLILQVRKTSAGGTNPNIFGVSLEYTS